MIKLSNTLFMVNGKTYKAYAIRGGFFRYAVRRIMEDGIKKEVCWLSLGHDKEDYKTVEEAFEAKLESEEWSKYYASI